MKILTILAVAYILFIHGLGSIALWDPDEPRQAIMAREMMERKDYIHPYLNGRPYLEKPPFFPWMIAVASKIRGGVDEFSSRIPAALSAAFLLLVAYGLARRLSDGQAGLLSAMVLATNYQFLSNARESVMDMTFAFFIGLTIYLGYLALLGKRKGWFILAFLPSALAILSKGPAGLVIPAGILCVYLLVQREFKRFVIPLVLGCLLSLAVASLWFVLAGEEYWREFILRQNIARYTNAFDHIESVTYYFHKLFFNFLPWSILLPFALWHAFRKRYWLPCLWFVLTFLFFEFSMSKRAIYLLSLYPASAVLCGLCLRDKWSWLMNTSRTGTILKCFACLLAFLPVAGLVALHLLSDPVITVFRQASVSLYAYLAVLFLAGCLFFLMLARKSEKRALFALFFYLTCFGWFYHACYMPIMDRGFKSPKLITDHLKDLGKGREIYTYGFSSAAFIFYAGRPIHPLHDIKDIKVDERDIILIAEDKPSLRFKPHLERFYRPVRTARYEKEYYTFYVRKDGE
jgi:4-amino-4-deoxy-L-arabinose transferase-like glycosyltransferase